MPPHDTPPQVHPSHPPSNPTKTHGRALGARQRAHRIRTAIDLKALAQGSSSSSSRAMPLDDGEGHPPSHETRYKTQRHMDKVTRVSQAKHPIGPRGDHLRQPLKDTRGSPQMPRGLRELGFSFFHHVVHGVRCSQHRVSRRTACRAHAWKSSGARVRGASAGF